MTTYFDDVHEQIAAIPQDDPDLWKRMQEIENGSIGTRICPDDECTATWMDAATGVVVRCTYPSTSERRAAPTNTAPDLY